MVSLGTFLTLGAIAAIAAGGYALYRNADKLGGALSRGVETNITAPLGSYLDTLWQDVTNSSINAVQQAASQTYQQASQGFVDAWNSAINAASTLTTNPIYPWMTSQPTQQPPPTTVQPLPTVEPLPILKPTFTQDFKSGYYYLNYPGSQYDVQRYQTAEQAAKTFGLFEKGIAGIGGRAIQDFTYLGKSELGTAGLELFGRSKGYL